MNVRQLIGLLLDQPMSNTVYVGDIAHGFTERHWDGVLLDVTGSEPGVFATFLEFNEAGLNGYIDIAGSETPAPVPGRTITESKYTAEVERIKSFGLNTSRPLWWQGRAILGAAGITIVPDPEPTNAEKIEVALTRLPWLGKDERRSIAEQLDISGVKATTNQEKS